MVADVGNQMLKKLGYDVLVARDGKGAIKYYEKKKNEIDILILDMVMPDVKGGEVYDKIKEINPHAKVLLSSGYGMEDQAAEILEKSCDGFIQKPFSMEALSKKITEVIEKSSVRLP
jgi:two-component system cell cycle sensor histidine kinase/response regulator CckA